MRPSARFLYVVPPIAGSSQMVIKTATPANQRRWQETEHSGWFQKTSTRKPHDESVVSAASQARKPNVADWGKPTEVTLYLAAEGRPFGCCCRRGRASRAMEAGSWLQRTSKMDVQCCVTANERTSCPSCWSSLDHRAAYGAPHRRILVAAHPCPRWFVGESTSPTHCCSYSRSNRPRLAGAPMGRSFPSRKSRSLGRRLRIVQCAVCTVHTYSTWKLPVILRSTATLLAEPLLRRGATSRVGKVGNSMCVPKRSTGP